MRAVAMYQVHPVVNARPVRVARPWIGKLVLNHSFMVPGIVSTLISTGVALALSSAFIR